VPGCPAEPAYTGLAYGILVSRTPAADGTYSIAMVDATGRVVARASYHTRQGINASLVGGEPTFASAPISTSNSRLYYLDGDNDVHMLAPDGTTGIVTHLPGNDHIRSAFAVNPDDRRIAVSVIDYSKSPASLQLYVEDLATGANRVEIFSTISAYVWPIGWHSCRLVVGVDQRAIESVGGDLSFNPYGAGSYHLINAATGAHLATIGGASCEPTGPLSPAGTACHTGVDVASVLDWTGQQTMPGMPSRGGFLGAAAVDSAGTALAICCDMTGVVLDVRGSLTHASVWGWPLWIDEGHVLVGDGSTTQPQPALIDLSGGSNPVNASGYVFGRIPGSL
jgi:hypothetical protein